MYESFYGLKEKPFSMLPDPGFLYLSKKHQKALTLFEYGLMNHAGFCVITGEIGSGKTTILRKLLENMNRKIAVGMITNTHKGFGDLLDWVLSAFDIHEKGLNDVEKHQRFVDFLLEQYAAKKTTLLIVDEAQNMAADKLEELRMLSNINADKDQVLQIILAGQPELKDTLGLPELKQFVQRIAVDYHLGSLDQEDTCAYIAHRTTVAGAEEAIFTEDASKLIYKYSGGTPRLINLLCDTAMVYGFADQQMVIDEDLVAEMIIERMQNSLVPLACTEPPKKKLRSRVDAEQVAEKSTVEQAPATPTDIVETTATESQADEHDFGEKVLQATVAEANQDEEPEEKVVDIEEEIKRSDISDSEQQDEFSEHEKTVSDPGNLSSQNTADNFNLLNSVVLGLVILLVIVLLFSLGSEDDVMETVVPVADENKSKSETESINKTIEPLPQVVDQVVVHTIPDEIKKQLDESQKIQQEMEIRQQEDRARVKVLEEQAALLKRERDKALASAEAEKEKRAAEAEAARIAVEREQEAQKIAQEAMAAAQAEAQRVKLLEELRAKEKQESEAALQVQQEEIDAVVEPVDSSVPEIETEKEEPKTSTDVRCQGPAARFLSICR